MKFKEQKKKGKELQETLGESILEQVPKVWFDHIVAIVKVVLGLICAIYAMVLAKQAINTPALWETKVYYIYISLFLMLGGLDFLVDSLCEKLTFTKWPKTVIFCSVLITVLYIPFVVIGFMMGGSRMKTSWDARSEAYLNYESVLFNTSQSHPPEATYGEFYARANGEAHDFAFNISNEYACFSCLALLALLQNIYQLCLIKWEDQEMEIWGFAETAGDRKWWIEAILFKLIGGIFSITVLLCFLVKGNNYESTEDNSPDITESLEELLLQGRYAKYASEDFSIGVETQYSLFFAAKLILEALSHKLITGRLIHLCRGNQRKNKCGEFFIGLLVNILTFALFGYVLSLVINVGQTAEFSFKNPAVLFYITLLLDACLLLLIVMCRLIAFRRVICQVLSCPFISMYGCCCQGLCGAQDDCCCSIVYYLTCCCCRCGEKQKETVWAGQLNDTMDWVDY